MGPVIYSRRRIEEAQRQSALFGATESSGDVVGAVVGQVAKKDPDDKAVEILNRAGARQWIGEDSVWCISIHRDRETDEDLKWALKQLEDETGRSPVVIWNNRKD